MQKTTKPLSLCCLLPAAGPSGKLLDWQIGTGIRDVMRATRAQLQFIGPQ